MAGAAARPHRRRQLPLHESIGVRRSSAARRSWRSSSTWLVDGCRDRIRYAVHHRPGGLRGGHPLAHAAARPCGRPVREQRGSRGTGAVPAVLRRAGGLVGGLRALLGARRRAARPQLGGVAGRTGCTRAARDVPRPQPLGGSTRRLSVRAMVFLPSMADPARVCACKRHTDVRRYADLRGVRQRRRMVAPGVV